MKKDKTTCRPGMTRRQFIGAASSVAAFAIVPRHVLGGAGRKPPSDKLNIAGIGVGGQGFVDLYNVSTENIVALCDVDDKRAQKTYWKYPKARRYHDFRRMLEKERKSIDAVVIATTDHVHVPASVMALKMGKPCYTEKPLGHNVHEVRVVTELAKKTSLATQLGTGAHSGYNYRSVAKMVKDGVIGEVKEVHCWCDKAWHPGDRPKNTPPVPKHLKWDLWLGPAPFRPYHPCYIPQAWRSWWDFGNGRLGDMGCHMIDLPFTALDLKYPLTVEAEGKPVHKESSPLWMIAKWTFPKRGDLAPVELTWYDGNKRPPLQKAHNMPDWPEATLFVGSKGMLIADYGRFKLYPEKDFEGVRRPKLEPRSIHHQQEWITACKEGASATGSNFGYSGPLTETVLLGTVAFRAGEKIQWDPVKMEVTNCPKANAFVRRVNRKGW